MKYQILVIKMFIQKFILMLVVGMILTFHNLATESQTSLSSDKTPSAKQTSSTHDRLKEAIGLKDPCVLEELGNEFKSKIEQEK